MPARIAIPMPHSTDAEYSERAIPQYELAVQQAGGKPVRIPLDENSAEVMKIIESCDGALLPGSKADVDPAKFQAVRSARTAAADVARQAVDELLLRDAYRRQKPLLGICYGLQSLNVFQGGSIVQHIPDFVSEEKRGKVNHEAGKTVAVAHTVEIELGSRLAKIVDTKDGSISGQGSEVSRPLVVPVNSSHHQSAEKIGEGLRIVARCPDDGIVEGLEGTSDDHFVLAVQWHPERSMEQDEPSRAIFRAFVDAASQR